MKNGFSLIELMIAISILAIVVAVGVPSFTTTIQNNRLASQTNGFIGAINYARSEAIKLGQNSVTVCESTTGTSCSSGNNWETGYVIFRDTDSDGSLDTGEQVLRVGEPLSGGNTLTTSGLASSSAITFDFRGMITSQGSFTFCDDRGAQEAKAIVLNISGQARIATDDEATPDGIVNIERDPNDANATIGQNASC